MKRLELGAGYHPTPGFMTLDLNPKTEPDFVGSAFPLPASVHFEVEDKGLFDELRAVDVLEHLSYRDSVAALTEWASITKPGGKLYVQVPNAEEVMHWYAFDKAKLLHRLPPDLPQEPVIGAAWRLLGGHADGVCVEAGDDWRWNAHFALFTRQWLATCLEQAGWEVESMTTNEHPNLMCWATRT